MGNLTLKQQKFIEAYDGNAIDAARKAGYSGSYSSLGVQAHDNLKNPKIVAAIQQRNAEKLNKTIATREERQKFWSDTMRDKELDINARIKASELLGKSEADFRDKLDVSGSLNIDGLSKWITEMRRSRGLPDE